MGLLTVHADQFVAEEKCSTKNKRTNERRTYYDESLLRKLLAGGGSAPLRKVRVRGAPTCHAASKHDVDDLGSIGTETHNARAMLLPSRKRPPISLQKPVQLERDTRVRRRSRAVVMSRHNKNSSA